MNIKFDCLELAYNHQIQLRFKSFEDGVEENLRTVIAGEVGETITVSHPTGRPVTLPSHPILKAVSQAFPMAEFKNPDGPCEHADFIRVMFNDPSQIRYNITRYAYANETEVLKATKMRAVGVDCLEDLSAHPEKVQKFCNIVFTPEVKAQYIASLPRVEVEDEDVRQVTVDLAVMIPNPEYGALIPNPAYGQLINNPDYDPEEKGSQEFIRNTSVPEQIKNVWVPEEIQKTEIMNEWVEPHQVLDGAVLRDVDGHEQPVLKRVVEAVGVEDENGSPVMEAYKTGTTTTFIEYKGNLYPEDWDGQL